MTRLKYRAKPEPGQDRSAAIKLVGGSHTDPTPKPWKRQMTSSYASRGIRYSIHRIDEVLNEYQNRRVEILLRVASFALRLAERYV